MRGKVIHHARRPTQYFIDDKPVTQAQFDAVFHDKPLGVPMLSGNTPSAWPMKLDALGVHPSQVKEAMERNRKAGLHIEYDKQGTPIVPDRRTRAKLIALENSCIQGGVRDNSGGYEECVNTEKPPALKKKLSEAFVDEGIRCNTEAMVKAARKKFTGKE